MTGGGELWVGADPGGEGNFGIAILTDDHHPQSLSVDCADEAIAFVRAYDRTPAGVGVDAPPCGGRPGVLVIAPQINGCACDTGSPAAKCRQQTRYVVQR
jgi:hypothetical protein